MPAKAYMKIYLLPRNISGGIGATLARYKKELVVPLTEEVNGPPLGLELVVGDDMIPLYIPDHDSQGLGEELLVEIDLGFMSLGADRIGKNHDEIAANCKRITNRVCSRLALIVVDLLPQCTAVAVKLEADCGSGNKVFRKRLEVNRSVKEQEGDGNNER